MAFINRVDKLLQKHKRNSPLLPEDDNLKNYSLEEARQILRISKEKFQELIHDPQQNFPKFRPHREARRYLVNRRELLKWVEKRTKQGT